MKKSIHHEGMKKSIHHEGHGEEHPPRRQRRGALSVLATLASATVAVLAWQSLSLPDRLTSAEFWHLSTRLSEAPGTFISDNVVSNELSYAQTVPHFRLLRRGGVYLGVGPEQNFTFISAMEARLAIVMDIRRENLLLHLLYKALFELSEDRAAFLSRLFGRPPPPQMPDATARRLMDYYASVPGDTDLFSAHAADLRRRLTNDHHFDLTDQDLATLDRLHRLFFRHGPTVNYTSTHNTRVTAPVTFAVLMSQAGADGRELSFLATDQAYEFVRRQQVNNLIVPVVGNLAGPKAIRAVGAFLRASGADVTAFYLSNVEDYLGKAPVPPNGRWLDFCANVAALPIGEHSVFVRPLGLAWMAPDGRMLVNAETTLGLPASADKFVYHGPVLPSPMFQILPEIRGCQ
jgi:hypothetical protein